MSESALGRTGRALKKLAPKNLKALKSIQRLDPVKAIKNATARRTTRRSPSGLQFALADSVDFLNTLHWDSLAGQTLFLSRTYLQVLEQQAPENMRLRYALIYEGGNPIAALLMQRLAIAGEKLRAPGKNKGLVAASLKRLEEHMLVCGNVLVWGQRGMAVAEGVDRLTLWKGVCEALFRTCRADRRLGEADLSMVKDFGGADEDCAALRQLGYRSVETEPDMVLAIQPHWKTFDDYLKDLTANYRSNAKKLLKDCAAANITLRHATAAEMLERQDELHNLYLQVHDAQGLRLATLRPAYLPQMAQALGAKFVCRVAEQDGKWLGFVTSVLDGDSAVGYYVGYDRPSNETAPIYLTLLQSSVEDAILLGAKQLSLGRTALEPKAKMGCQPQTLACAVRHRISAANWVVSALTRTAEHDMPPERNPFKKKETEKAKA